MYGSIRLMHGRREPRATMLVYVDLEERVSQRPSTSNYQDLGRRGASTEQSATEDHACGYLRLGSSDQMGTAEGTVFTE